ncbi:MAG: type II secretion system protein GspL [Pseudomonadota bacterium]
MTVRIYCLLSEMPSDDRLRWAVYDGDRPLDLLKSDDVDVVSNDELLSGDLNDLFNFVEQLINSLNTTIELVGVLPGEACTMRQMPTPPKSGKKFRAAANLLLEDELAQPIDDVHVATSTRTGVDGEVIGTVIAVKEKIISAWVASFKEASLELTALTVDFLCFEAAMQTGAADIDRRSLVVFPSRMLWFDGARGFAAEVGLAGSLLEKLVAENNGPIDFYGSEKLFMAHFQSYATYKGPIDEYRLLGYIHDAYASPRKPISLLQGPYRVRKNISFDLSIWRRASVLAASFALAFFALLAIEGQRTSARAARYQAEAERLYTENFPGRPVTNMRARVRATLASGGASSFADLSARLSIALKANERVSINRILFDTSRQTYSFTIASDSNSAIDEFRQSLAAAGIVANDASGYRRSGDFWVGEMTASLQ